MSIPETMKAIVVQDGGKIAIEERPVPSLTKNEVLVKVKAVSQNPTEYILPLLVGLRSEELAAP